MARDRTVDALRAVAIAGVVLGHWLVSAVVSDPYQPAALHGESPLTNAPWLAPATWLFQTLGPFFFAGGYAAARSRATLASRLRRTGPPILALAAVWVPALLLLTAVDAPDSTVHLVLSLVTHPLWFLVVYLMLTAATPLLRIQLVLPAVAFVALTDALRPSGLGLLAVPVGWAVPFILGIALAQDRLPRRAGVMLLGTGLVGGAALVLLAGYPASAVGVPGDGRSNLDPPSLFALALAFVQVGGFLLVRPRLARLMERPRLWLPVGLVNLAAMTIYCWHQTALLLVTFAALLAGPVPGLLDHPDGAWIWHRLAWLPLFILVLAMLALLFHRFERPRQRSVSSGSAGGPTASGSSGSTTAPGPRRPAPAGRRPARTRW